MVEILIMEFVQLESCKLRSCKLESEILPVQILSVNAYLVILITEVEILQRIMDEASDVLQRRFIC